MLEPHYTFAPHSAVVATLFRLAVHSNTKKRNRGT